MRVVCGTVLLAVAVGVFACWPAPRPIPDFSRLQRSSVMLVGPGVSGSGVCFRNGERLFIWTAAHVVASAIREQDGEFFSLRVGVVQDVAGAGGHAYQVVTFATVVAYSEFHDLAVLQCPVGVPFASAHFCPKVPGAGDVVWHVGSPFGARGLNSVSGGVVAYVGRYRYDGARSLEPDAVVYDQVSLTAFGGCSGGGVFRADGACIGLVIEFLGPEKTPGILCIAPTRRMLEFAREARCEWALSPAVPVPDRLSLTKSK